MKSINKNENIEEEIQCQKLIYSIKPADTDAEEINNMTIFGNLIDLSA